jgi:hypothetical protein
MNGYHPHEFPFLSKRPPQCVRLTLRAPEVGRRLRPPLCGTLLNPTLSYPAVGVQHQRKSRCAARRRRHRARPGGRGTKPLAFPSRELVPGQWQGPAVSGYGVHLVGLSNQEGGSAGGGSTTVSCWRLRKATTTATHPVQVGSISTTGRISSMNVGRSKG